MESLDELAPRAPAVSVRAAASGKPLPLSFPTCVSIFFAEYETSRPPTRPAPWRRCLHRAKLCTFWDGEGSPNNQTLPASQPRGGATGGAGARPFPPRSLRALGRAHARARPPSRRPAGCHLGAGVLPARRAARAPFLSAGLQVYPISARGQKQLAAGPSCGKVGEEWEGLWDRLVASPTSISKAGVKTQEQPNARTSGATFVTSSNPSIGCIMLFSRSVGCLCE